MPRRAAGRQVATRGDSWVFAIPASELLVVQGGYAKPRALGHEDLLFRMYRSSPGSEARRGFERELFGRLALSLAPLVFAACGIPLALILGKGTRAAAAVLSFGVAVAYFVLWQFGSSLAAASCFALFALSPFGPTAQFGTMMCIATLLAMLTNQLLLPIVAGRQTPEALARGTRAFPPDRY